MAEALSVVGAIASTIQLLDFTTKVFDRLNYLRRVDELPECLQGISLNLPLFIEALRRTQFHHGHLNYPQFSYFNVYVAILLSESFIYKVLNACLYLENNQIRLNSS